MNFPFQGQSPVASSSPGLNPGLKVAPELPQKEKSTSSSDTQLLGQPVNTTTAHDEKVSLMTSFVDYSPIAVDVKKKSPPPMTSFHQHQSSPFHPQQQQQQQQQQSRPHEMAVIIGQSTSTLSSSSSSSSNFRTTSSGRRARTVWTTTEDEILVDLVKNSTTSKLSWIKIATSLNESAGSRRTHKQCRERWLNHLRPGLKKGEWTTQEENMIRYYHNAFGGKWSAMARVFVDRSEADLKNKWNSMQRSEKRKRAAKNSALAAAAWVAQDAMKEDASYPHDFGMAFPPSGGEHYTFVTDAESSIELADIFGTKPDTDA